MPTALATILVGVNQTIMAALSMIVIAAMVGGALLSVLLGLMAQIATPLDRYPVPWTFYPADYLNQGLGWFTVTFFPLTSTLKMVFLVYLLLPLRIGLAQTMQPALWFP